jgi:hypothetical protein
MVKFSLKATKGHSGSERKKKSDDWRGVRAIKTIAVWDRQTDEHAAYRLILTR